MSQPNGSEAAIELGHIGNSPVIEGYPSLSAFIARDRDAAIYRKYARLSARSLLYQQSELHALERQLDEFDAAEARDIENEEARKAAVLWEYYSSAQSQPARNRRVLQAKIKRKLKEYHEALVLESQVLSLNAPGRQTLRDFRRRFKLGNDPMLWGHDELLFEDERDLAALAPVDTDRLNLFLKKYFGYFFREETSGAFPGCEGLYYIPEWQIQYASLVVSTLLSAVLLVGAIVCLLLLSNQRIGLRVSMIVVFTSLFAAVVGLLTNARRAEIFASTAAYAAVLVVFISNIRSP